MRKALIGLLLGGSLVLLPLSTARGDENTGLSASRDVGWTALRVPPVPYLGTIHWPNSGFDFSKRPNVLGGRVDLLSPLLIDPKAPAMQFLLSRETDGTGFRQAGPSTAARVPEPQGVQEEAE